MHYSYNYNIFTHRPHSSPEEHRLTIVNFPVCFHPHSSGISHFQSHIFTQKHLFLLKKSLFSPKNKKISPKYLQIQKKVVPLHSQSQKEF